MALVISSLSCIIVPEAVSGYSAEFDDGTPATHARLSNESIELLGRFSSPAYAELAQYRNQIVTGATHEDSGDGVGSNGVTYRFFRHFYRPLDNAGLTVDAFIGFGGTYDSAVDWGYENDDNYMDWTDALALYEQGDKAGAYYALGHVVHLLQDMSVPEHTHLDEHTDINLLVIDDPCYYENYVKDNHDALFAQINHDTVEDFEGYLGDPVLQNGHQDLFDYPSVVIRRPTFQDFMHDMAMESYMMNRFQADLSDHDNPTGQVQQMFPELYWSWFWQQWDIPDVGNWEPDPEVTDEWWECALNEGNPDTPGYYYFENTMAVPYQNQMTFNPTNLELREIEANYLMPLAIRYSAGLLELFYNLTHISVVPPAPITMTEDLPAWTIDLDNIFQAPFSHQLTFSATGNSNVACTIGSNHTVRIAPSLDFNGATSIQVSATDPITSETRSFNVPVTVLPVNDAPVATFPTAVTVIEDIDIHVPITISDPDTPMASITVSVDMPGVEFVPSNSTIRFQLGNGALPGPLHITVSDGSLFVSLFTTVTFVPVNDPPRVQVPANVMATEDVLLVVPITLSDIDSPLSSLEVSTDDDRCTWNSSSGQLEILLGEGAIPFELLVTVSDGLLENATWINVGFIPVNDPPLIQVPTNTTVLETIEKWVAFQFSDIDTPFDQLTFTSSVPWVHPLSNGTLWIVAPRGVHAVDATISVLDGEFTVESVIHIDVTPVNFPPVLRLPVGVTVREDIPETFSINISDPDTDASGLHVTLSRAWASWNASSGMITITLGEGNESSTLTVTLSDGELNVSGTLLVTFFPVNDPPEFGLPPELELIAGRRVHVPVSLTDVDSDPARLFMTFSIPGPYFIRENSTISILMPVGTGGVQDCTVTVSDGFDTTDATIRLVVIDPRQDDVPDGPGSVARQDNGWVLLLILVLILALLIALLVFLTRKLKHLRNNSDLV